MTLSPTPFGLVALSAATYTALLRTLRRTHPPPSPVAARAQVNAISAAHAALTTVVAVAVLSQRRWRLSAADREQAGAAASTQDGYLDDAANPVIHGRSRLANALTAWEAGYLAYDTAALFRAVPGAPVPAAFLGHHVLLLSALLYLQLYIAQARERGLHVISAFVLMNATTPLLHARWWMAKTRRGKVPLTLDAAFVGLFGAVRFGVVAWILQRYGAYHGLGPVQVFRRLRMPCQVGTVTLMSMNGVWWCLLIRNLVIRMMGMARKGAQMNR